MRISDWSSDVCSSDLKNKPECTEDQAASLVKAAHVRPGALAGAPRCRGYRQATAGYREPVHKFAPDAADRAAHAQAAPCARAGTHPGTTRSGQASHKRHNRRATPMTRSHGSEMAARAFLPIL